MHELPVTENIFKLVLAKATENNAKKVHSITIRMGEGCDFVPEIIEEYLQIFAEGTVIKGAKIIPDIIPTTIKCLECGGQFKKDLYMYNCPKCGSDRLRPEIKSDLIVSSIEME